MTTEMVSARAPFKPGNGSFGNSHRPWSRGTFRVDAPHSTTIYAVDRGLVSRPSEPHRTERPRGGRKCGTRARTAAPHVLQLAKRPSQEPPRYSGRGRSVRAR